MTNRTDHALAQSARRVFHFDLEDTYESKIGNKIIPQRNGCWLYRNSTERRNITVHGKPMPVYRWVYETLIGPIPDGYLLHHKCETPGCVNPMHLWPVTHKEHGEAHAELRKATR